MNHKVLSSLTVNLGSLPVGHDDLLDAASLLRINSAAGLPRWSAGICMGQLQAAQRRSLDAC